MHASFNLFEKRDLAADVDVVKTADSLVSFASSHVLHNLIKPIKMPWERNPVLNPKRAYSCAFPDLGQSTVGMRDFAFNVGNSDVPEHVASAPGLEHTLKRARLASCVSSPDDLRLRALSLIRIMVDADRSKTKLALQVGTNLDVPVPLGPSLRDAFSGKATATLYKRTNAMWGLFAWIRAHGGSSGLELTEGRLYEYLCHLRASQKGATSGESVLQAVRFFNSILGIVGFDASADISARVLGVSREMYLAKPLLKQARALYVLELKALENAVLEERQPHLVVIAGYLLFCAMAVCRFSDPLYSTGLKVSRSRETVLVEAGTSVHKTAHTKERKTMLLPLMALGKVFRTDKSWGERWVTLLHKQFAHLGKPYVLPAYSEQTNQWLARPMTTAEGVLWLRDIVRLRCKSGETLTTHSLKATMLSWVTICNVLDFQQRRILGHHVDTGMASPLTYGRDNLTPLQVQLAGMLTKIGNGTWDPDATRVQRLDIDIEMARTMDDLDQDHEGAVYGPFSQPMADADEMERAVETDDKVEQSQGDDKFFISASNADGRLMQHNISGVLHFLGVEDRFVCGRPVSQLYGAVCGDLSHEWPVCQQCRRIMGEEVIGSYIET